MIVCTEIKQKQSQDRKTIFETLSLPVAKILSPVVRQAPTKAHQEVYEHSENSEVGARDTPSKYENKSNLI